MRAIGTLVWRTLLAVDRLIRLHFIDFSGLLPLLGAATVRRQLRVSEILALLGVATCFHVFAYVLNDVVDLPIDRTQPLRQADPLVRGAIRRWQALTIALGAIPLTLPLTHWLGGGGSAHSALLVGFAAMTAYNLWGKRGRVPPLTDAIQGIAWGSLAVYGAYAIGGAPSMLTWVVAAYAAGFILLINGIHGGLRDLNNDFARGARTTAIFIGARPGAAGGAPRVPAGVPIFAYAVSVSLTILSMLPLLSNAFGYGARVRLTMLVVIGALNVVALTLLWTVVHPRLGNFWEVAFRVQMLTVVLILPASFVPYVSVAIRWTVVLLVIVSLLPLDWTYRTLHLLVLRVIRRPSTFSDPDAPLAPSFATRDG